MLLAAACGDGDDAEPAVSPSPPAGADAIRDVDFTRQADVQAALARLGGAKLAQDEIAYADVTGDRREEAVVPITSGGTLGNISYLVFTMKSGAPSLALTRALDRTSPSGLVMKIEEGVLVEYVGEYGPEDPLCCPSVLRRTTFRWDGSKFQVAGEERVPAAQRKQ